MCLRLNVRCISIFPKNVLYYTNIISLTSTLFLNILVESRIFGFLRELFSVKISSYECHFLCKYHWFLCLKKKKKKKRAKKGLLLGSSWQPKKNLKSLQGHFQILLSLLHTIWLPYHLVGIIGIKDITFFFLLILVLFLKGDINDKNHMVVGTRALISAFKHCCNNMH